MQRRFYQGWELENYRSSVRFRDSPTYWLMALWKLPLEAAKFILGPLLLCPFIMLPWILLDRRTRFLLIAGAVTLSSLAAEVFYNPHYAAPVTSVLFALSMQGLRHVHACGRRWPGAIVLVRALPAAYLLMLVAAIAIHMRPWCLVPDWPLQPCGELPTGGAAVLKELESRDGEHLAIVAYRPDHDVLDEWVYNRADIDGARVVWSRELGTEENDELLRYFAGRHAWLVEPDNKAATIRPYAK